MKFLLSITLLVFGFNALAVQDPAFIKVKDAINSTITKEDHGIQFTITDKTTTSNNIEVIYGSQLLDGKKIYGANFTATFAKGKLVSMEHSLIVNPKVIKAGEASIKPQSALQQLFNDYAVDDTKLTLVSAFKYSYYDAAVSDEAVALEEKWMLFEGKLQPINEISIYDLDHEHWYNSRFSAISGSLLDRNDWVTSCDLPSHKHTAIASALPKQAKATAMQKTHANSSYEVFAIPVESPNHGNRTVAIDPDDSLASPFGWHDVNGSAGAEYTITRGNNVYASDDKNNDNIPGSSPDGGLSLNFTSTFDKAQSAALYTEASVVNLFYWNNMMHDVWYHYGFDEASGNFQEHNYSRGGSASDGVNADAQDGSGTNNANFATPPDGTNPRMQMYIWNSGSSSGDHFQVNSPSTAAGKYLSSRAAFGAVLSATPVTGDLVITDPVKACNTIANNTDLNGNIAFIERGNCTFVQKVRNAQTAGAIAVVIYDSTGNNPIFMGGTASDITIPVVMIKRTDGIFIRNLISGGVNVSLYDSATAGASTFDSDFDAGIIAHEYGHGISIRLTGGASNSNCLSNQEQMGEGWSDFFGLVMTHEAGDAGSDIRGIGTYVTNQSTTGGGIRQWPYSTNMNNSPYTYNHIRSLSVPHGVGSVWCAMLWDMYWSFVDEYGYDADIYEGTGGNNMAMQLVIDGLKLQPCNPGFEDGRDAILLADRLNNDGNNQKMIWEVFARRGLGHSADQGSSGSRSDGITAFDIPPIYKDALYIEKRAPVQVKNQRGLEYSLVAKNFSGKTIYNIVLTDTLPEGLELSADDIDCGTLDNGIITITLDSLENKDSFICEFTPLVLLQKATTTLFEDDIEDGAGDWIVTSDMNTNKWVITTAKANSGSSSWRVLDINTQSDQSLSHEFTISGTQPVLSFYHFYNTEAGWDGGVIEIKDGNQWVDAKPYFLLNGYNSTISQNQASTLSNREGYTGNSQEFINSKIDLSSFNNKTIEIRFRFASDGALGGEGWYIDDVVLEDAAQIENFLHASFDPGKESRTSSLTFVTEPDNVSVETYKSAGFKMYPNPAQDELFIEWDGHENFKVTVMDIHAKKVIETKAQNGKAINLNALRSGVYVVEISSADGLIRQKILID